MSTPGPATRVDPFASLDDFQPAAPTRPKPEPAAVRQASEDNNFLSRAPKPRAAIEAKPEPRVQRRHRTGRNVQVNIKTTADTIQQLTRISDANGWVFGETLARALDALEASNNAK